MLICLKVGLPANHFLSSCKFLSESDRRFMMRARALQVEQEQGDYEEECNHRMEPLGSNRVICDNEGCVNKVDIRPSANLRRLRT